VGVGVGVVLGVGVGVVLGLGVAVGFDVGVAVAVGFDVGVAVPVGLGVGVRAGEGAVAGACVGSTVGGFGRWLGEGAGDEEEDADGLGPAAARRPTGAVPLSMGPTP